MRKTLKILNELRKDGLVEEYAIGGGVAVLFYVEPIFTSDLDIFCLVPMAKASLLTTLSPIYDFFKKKGYKFHKEQIVIEGVPVQFIPAYNELVEAAITHAKEIEYEGIKTKVVGLEYLIAIMIQTNRPKDRERIFLILEEAKIKQEVLNKILKRHGLMNKWKEVKKEYDRK